MDASAQSPQSQSISPLRQRMLDDMRMRKLCDKTQSHYIRAVRRLVKYLGRSPDTATAEDLRNFQLHLVDEGTSAPTLNATITGLPMVQLDITRINSALETLRFIEEASREGLSEDYRTHVQVMLSETTWLLINLQANLGLRNNLERVRTALVASAHTDPMRGKRTNVVGFRKKEKVSGRKPAEA